MTPASLTIGIPTLNRAAMVVKVVEACLEQTRRPLRIVVSDNASHDDTQERLEKLACPWLKVVHQPSRVGMVANWNACLQEADGDWFVLLSDDDMIAPDFVEHVELGLAAAPDVDLLVMRCRVFDALTGRLDENPPPVRGGGELDILDCIVPAWLAGLFTLPLAGMVFRRSVLQSRGGFSSELPFAADVATWLPLAVHGRCGFWPEAKADYLLHPGMMTLQFPIETRIDDVISIGRLVSREIKNTGRPESRKRALEDLSSTFISMSHGDIMIRAARSRVPKTQLCRAWWRSCRRLPHFGLSPVAIAAVIVPPGLIGFVGRQYRRWRDCRKWRHRDENSVQGS